MVSVGDKISISKTKTGYIGSKSSNPVVGNKIGNNEFGWKSGNPAVGNKIVINMDNQGRYLGWKSGFTEPGTGCVDKSCPAIINVSGYWQVCSAYSDSVSYSGGEVYDAARWSRDSDHVISYGGEALSAFTPEISINCTIDDTHDYWLSSSPSTITGFTCDDDFSIYVNGSRVLRKHIGPAMPTAAAFRLNSFLTDGDNTVKMFFKDWWGTSFSYPDLYVIEVDKSEDPSYCSTLLVDSQYTPLPYTYDFWGSYVNFNYPSTQPNVYISGCPYGLAPVQSIAGMKNSVGYADTHIDMFIDGVLKLSFYANSYQNIKPYLSVGNQQIMLHYNANIYYDIAYISPAYLVMSCTI